MKKVLFASTALVATAGVAAAEISMSGSARFGVIYFEDAADELQVHNRFTLNFDGTAETDSGAEFFARVRVRGDNTGEFHTLNSREGRSLVSAPRVGVRSGGFTLAVGNINGALESTPGLYSHNVGLTGLGWGNLPLNASGAGPFAWDSFSSAGAGVNGVELIYSSGAFGAHLSHSGAGGLDRTAVHVSYKFNDWTVALGHQESDIALEDMTLLTVGGNIGSASVSLAYASNEGDNDALRIGAGFEFGSGTNVNVYYTAADGTPDDSYGIGFTHSLGGATLAGGIAQTFSGQTRADIGVRFNF